MIAIAGRNKVSLTRPKYSLDLMGGEYSLLSMGGMREVLRDNNEICHVAYTVLMDANVDEDDVSRIHTDGESVAITLRSSKLAKHVKDACKKTTVRYGTRFYRPIIKVHDKHVIIELEKLATEEIDE